MAEWNVYNKNCPTRLVLDRIADKWTVLTVGALAEETKRFGQLRRELVVVLVLWLVLVMRPQVAALWSQAGRALPAREVQCP